MQHLKRNYLKKANPRPSQNDASVFGDTPKKASTNSSVESNGLWAVTDTKKKIGLTVVVVSTPLQRDDPPTGVLRLAIEQDILDGDQRVGLGYSRSKNSKLLWAGADDELRDVRSSYRQGLTTMSSKISVISLGEYDCDWLSGAGYCAVDRQLDEQTGLMTFFMPISGAIAPLAVTNLGKLRVKAKAVGCHVIIFWVVDSAFDPKSLIGMVDKLIEIKTCESDPDKQWAFSIEHVSQGHFSAAGGKLLGQMSRPTVGMPEICFSPFLDEKLSPRVQWHMNRHGAINKDIGIAFGIDGSTVYRNLQNLPKNMQSWLDKNELHRLLSLTLGDEAPAKSMRTSTDLLEQIDTDSDDDFDLDLDEDDEVQVPKKRSKRGKTIF